MKIRRAELQDAEVITRFNIDLAAETEDLHLDPACVSAGVRALLKDPGKGVYFVAEQDGMVIGQVMITYEWSDWRNANLWWLQSVYVRRDFRGRGVFAGLFRHLRKLAETTPEVCGIRLYMHDANQRARSAYEKIGMTQTHYLVFELELRGGRG